MPRQSEENQNAQAMSSNDSSLNLKTKPSIGKLFRSPFSAVKAYREYRAEKELRDAVRENQKLPAEDRLSNDELLSNVAAQKHGKIDLHQRHVGLQGGGEVAASAHEVSSVSFRRNLGDSGSNVGFFKKAATETGSDIAQYAGIKDQNENGQPVDPRLIARSLASSRINETLGQNTLAPEIQMKRKGEGGTEYGVVSARANGSEFMTTTNFGDQPVAQSVNESIDLKNPEVQQGFANIQFMDYLTGQIDRHEGNIFVDQDTGQVTGIDNDLAFGINNEAVKGDGGNNFGLPPLVDQKMADAFNGMSERDFKSLLKGERNDFAHLNKEEIDAAVDRFRNMKAHLQSENVQIVGKGGWGEDTYQKSIEKIKGDNGEIKAGRWDRGDTLISRSVQSQKVLTQARAISDLKQKLENIKGQEVSAEQKEKLEKALEKLETAQAKREGQDQSLREGEALPRDNEISNEEGEGQSVPGRSNRDALNRGQKNADGRVAHKEGSVGAKAVDQSKSPKKNIPSKTKLGAG